MDTSNTIDLAHSPINLFFNWLTYHCKCVRSGGLIVSALNSGSSGPGRVRALAGDIMLCSWARHFAITVPLVTQLYKWAPANLMLRGNPLMD